MPKEKVIDFRKLPPKERERLLREMGKTKNEKETKKRKTLILILKEFSLFARTPSLVLLS